MDYQCTQPFEIEICRQAEEIKRQREIKERNRVHEETMQILREMIKIQEEKRIAKEKEAAELEAKHKIQECLNIEEKSIPQASTRSRKFRIDPTLRNFIISTKRIPFSTVETVNSPKMGDKHLDTQKGSLESSVKDPIPILGESDVIFDGDCDDDYKKRFDLKVQQLWMTSIYDENNKIRECYIIRPSAITPDLPIPDSLIMEDEHLDTISVTESTNTIKSSVEDLVPTPSESADLSDGESECDVPINDDSPESYFSTFDTPLFDSNDDFSSDDESLSEEEIPKEEFKFFSNPLYDIDDEIITNEKILLNQKDLDIVIPIPPGIDEQIDLFLDNLIPSGNDNDDDSEGDILPLEELLDNVLSPLPESDDFTVDVEPVAAMMNDFDVLNNDEPFDTGGGENVAFLNVEEDNSFTFIIRTFLPFVTYPSLLFLLHGSEDTIFLTPASSLRAGGISSGWNFHVL
ncbi:hypothetical protein Tco_0545267 [Tanacetum coccineum]